MSVTDQTRAAIWEIRTVSRFLPSKTAIETETSAEAIIAVLVRNYEVPANPDEDIKTRVAVSGERSLFGRTVGSGLNPNGPRRPLAA